MILPVKSPYPTGLTTHDLYALPSLSAEVDRGFKTVRATLKAKVGVAISHQFGTEGGKLVHVYEVRQ